MSEEVGKVPVIVANEEMLVIAHRDEPKQGDVVAEHRFGEAIEIDLLDVVVGAEEKLALCTTPASQIGVPRRPGERRSLEASRADHGSRTEQATGQRARREILPSCVS